MPSVTLKYLLQRKKKENVLKIFTEVLFKRLHHTLVLTTFKISVPINLVFLLLATWFNNPRYVMYVQCHLHYNSKNVKVAYNKLERVNTHANYFQLI